VSNYLSNFVAEDRRWSYFSTANIAMAMDIADLDIPSPALIYNGYHWVLVKGVSYEDYYGSVYTVYEFWIHDPLFGENQYYSVDDWADIFTPVDVQGSYWDGYWTHVRGYWGTDAAGIAYPDIVSDSGETTTRNTYTTRSPVWSDTLVRPTPTASVDRETYYDQMTMYYEAVAKNVTLMADEEDDIPLTEDTDLADLGVRVRQMMIEQFGHKEEFEGTVPGEPVFVHSLDDKWHDYYLFPFERDGYISAIVQVSIKGDLADPGAGYAPSKRIQSVIRPTLEEARMILAEGGYDNTMPAQPVWKPCEQTQSSAVPVWEFTKDDGDTVYVGYVPWKKQVEFYEELTMKKIAG
jgi:hypothetical protein